MQDNEVIRILNELGFPVHRVSSSGRPEIRPRWEVMTDIIFHAMQRHVGEQGGKDRTLPCACLGGSEPAVSQRRMGRLSRGKVWSLRKSAVCSIRSKHFAMSASKQYLGCVLIALKMAPMASCTDRPGRKP